MGDVEEVVGDVEVGGDVEEVVDDVVEGGCTVLCFDVRG